MASRPQAVQRAEGPPFPVQPRPTRRHPWLLAVAAGMLALWIAFLLVMALRS